MSNSTNKTGITAEQAVQALLSQGYIFDFDQCQQSRVCLHNDADTTYYISDGYIILDRFYGTFELHSHHALSGCSIDCGELCLGPAFSRQILE